MDVTANARFRERVIFADGHCRAQEQQLEALLDAMNEWIPLSGEEGPVGDLIAALLDVSGELDTARAAMAAALQLALFGGRPAPLPTFAYHNENRARNAAMRLQVALVHAKFAQDCLDTCLSCLRVLRHLLATPALPQMPSLASAQQIYARVYLEAALEAAGRLVDQTTAALDHIGLGGGNGGGGGN